MEWWMWAVAWILAQPVAGVCWYLLKGRDRAYDARRSEFMEQLSTRVTDSPVRPHSGRDAA